MLIYTWYIYIYVYMYIIYIYIYMYVCMHTHTHMYIYTHTHIYICRLQELKARMEAVDDCKFLYGTHYSTPAVRGFSPKFAEQVLIGFLGQDVGLFFIISRSIRHPWRIYVPKCAVHVLNGYGFFAQDSVGFALGVFVKQ
jgi:hypothetical protein